MSGRPLRQSQFKRWELNNDFIMNVCLRGTGMMVLFQKTSVNRARLFDGRALTCPLPFAYATDF